MKSHVFLPAMLFALLPALTAAEPLRLNDLHPTLIVYEVPDTEGRTEVVRYIEFIRDRILPGVEIIDASLLDQAALRQKLRGTFLLYTTLTEHSRLLALAAGPLPIRVENGSFHWADLTAPVKEIRVAFAGKNPFGEGYAMVYAAGTNALLAQVNNLFTGPCSYHIFQGPGRVQALREGFYDASFSEKPNRIVLADALADVEEFFTTLERSHPNLLAHVEKSAYPDLKVRTTRMVMGAKGDDSKVSVEALAYALYGAGAFFKDGHTGIIWTAGAGQLRGKRFPPFWLSSENGRFYIDSANDPSLVGAELVRVNEASVVEFFKGALDLISAETLTYQCSSLARGQPFWYALANVFPDEAYTLTLREAAGATRQVAVHTIGLVEFQKLARQRGSHPPLEFLDGGKIAHLTVPDLNYGSPTLVNATFRERFQEISQHHATDLIVDIRGNGGGDSRMGDYILGLIRGGFTGKNYMLIDHGVFSSAVIFADTFRDSEAGILVGYETGGTPSHFGYPRQFTLKNSGIDYSVSRTEFQSMKPRPGDDRHGVLPDIPVTRELLVTYKDEADPVLAFVVAQIRRARQ